MENCCLVINLSANGGMGEKKWNLIRNDVLKKLKDQNFVPEIVTYRGEHNLDNLIRERMSECCCFISAGGDGTMNRILQILMKYQDEGFGPFTLGALGLGSSNDFLKPYGLKINGVPTRINRSSFIKADVGRVQFIDENERPQERFFLINASFGVTAEANHYFNNTGGIFAFFKRYMTHVAIVIAALRTIILYPGVLLKLDFGSTGELKIKTLNGTMKNVAILKSPHVSGSMTFDIPIRRDDGMFGIGVCGNLSIWELIRVLIDLNFGKFQNVTDERKVVMSPSLDVTSDNLIPFETDGEVQLGKAIHFEIRSKYLKILGV